MQNNYIECNYIRLMIKLENVKKIKTIYTDEKTIILNIKKEKNKKTKYYIKCKQKSKFVIHDYINVKIHLNKFNDQKIIFKLKKQR